GNGGDAIDRFTGGKPLLQALDVGLGDLGVTGDCEQQGDVDVDAVGNQGLDGGNPLAGGRHLDQDIGPVDPGVQLARFGHRAGGVVRQGRRDLDADHPVLAVASVVDRAQHVGGGADVLHRQMVEQLGGIPIRVAAYRFGDGVVVGVAAGDGLFEDGGVGGDPAHAVVGDQACQLAGAQHGPMDVVVPDALAEAV